MRICRSVLAVVAVLATVDSGFAASQRDWADCAADSADVSIAGCSRIVDDRSESAKDRATARTNRAIAFRQKGDNRNAIVDLTEAIKLDPTKTDAFYTRGNAYYDEGDFDLAIADYNATLRLDARYASAYNNRGLSYSKKGDLDRAIADFSEAIRLQPSARRYNNRGNAYKDKGQKDRAIADYREAVKLDPDSPAADELKALGARP